MHCDHAIQRVAALFEASCYDLLADYGQRIQRVYGVNFDTSDLPAARIDGGNQNFEMLVALHIPFSTLSLCYPVKGAGVSEEDLEDWISELANRLLGKLNAKLTAYQQSIRSGLPEFVLGPEPEFSELPLGVNHHYVFRFEEEMFAVHFSVEAFAEELEFSQTAVQNNSTVSDGDIEFF